MLRDKNSVMKNTLVVFLIVSMVMLLAGCRKYESIEIEQTTRSEIQDTATNIVEETIVEASKEDLSKKVACTKYATATLNVREEPSTDSTIIDKLEPNTEVNVIREYDDKWTEAYLNDGIYYVASEYLTEDRDWQDKIQTKNGFKNGDKVALNPDWKYAGFSKINSGNATMYLAPADRKNIVVGVNAGHGTKGGSNVKTYCHPDKTPKVTGGSTAAGATQATAVSSGMNFNDGTPESTVTLKEAQILKDILLSRGYDVLMLRDSDDVQLDNVARTVICNNVADCHIAIHWDGDGLDYDKGCFYMSVPDGIKYLDSVGSTWEKSEKLGDCLIKGLSGKNCKINGSGNMDIDLTQTSYSTIPSIDIELGNQTSDHSGEQLNKLASGIADGIDLFFR